MQVQDLKSVEGNLVTQDADANTEPKSDFPHSHLVSFLSEVPEPIQLAMIAFIERHPNWDQYRLIQAALAGFLVQNGVESRSITRLYLGNMFCGKSFGQDFENASS